MTENPTESTGASPLTAKIYEIIKFDDQSQGGANENEGEVIYDSGVESNFGNGDSQVDDGFTDEPAYFGTEDDPAPKRGHKLRKGDSDGISRSFDRYMESPRV